MANQPGFLSVDELDFKTYRDNLKFFLKQQTQFKDYDFEGSNMAVMLDLLAYNTYMNGTYLNLIGSEMFMDTARLRESIVSHAKELNYTPRSRASSVAFVDIAVTGNNLPSLMTIPKNYRIQGRAKNGQTFTFVTAEPINIGSANNHTAVEVPIYEGRVITEAFVANSTIRYVLSSANVDISSISVNVQESQTDSSNTDWASATTLFGVSSDTPAFFVQGFSDFKYEVVFGNGIVGRRLKDGNVVRVSYRNTLGTEANGIKLFSAEQAIEGFTSISVSLSNTNPASAGGTEHESDENIRFNAPRYFASQERAITSFDYVTLVRSQFQNLEAVTAYGGEEAYPKMYGKTIISAKPIGGEYLSRSMKDQVVLFLKNKTSLSIDPVFVDPDFYHVTVTTRVTYNVNATNKTPTELISATQLAINQFNSTNLSDFGTDLRFSRLVAAIDATDPSFVSNDTEVLITKKLYPVPKKIGSYAFDFGNALDTDAEQIVSSSSFNYRVGGTVYVSFIEDDGAGKLNVYTLDSRQQKVMLGTVGIVDYATGKVNINNMAVESLNGPSLNVSGKTRDPDIETSNNKLLLISPLDVTVSLNGIRI